ncbi:MAG: hypothetical protein ACK4NZ_08580, partial [Tsuneonella sp.]
SPRARPGVIIRCQGLRFSHDDLVEGLGQMNLTPPETQENSSKSGAHRQVERWDQFAAGLAFVAHTGGPEVFSSRRKLYDTVATFLATKSLDNALDEKAVRALLSQFLAWRDAD